MNGIETQGQLIWT